MANSDEIRDEIETYKFRWQLSQERKEWLHAPEPDVPTPDGWEGDPPSREITTDERLIEYLNWALKRLQDFRDGPIRDKYFDKAVQAIRNARRLRDEISVRWPSDPTAPAKAATVLSKMIRWLRRGGESSAASDTADDKRSSIPVRLDAKAVAVLICLADNPTRSLTQSQIETELEDGQRDKKPRYLNLSLKTIAKYLKTLEGHHWVSKVTSGGVAVTEAGKLAARDYR